MAYKTERPFNPSKDHPVRIRVEGLLSGQVVLVEEGPYDSTWTYTLPLEEAEELLKELQEKLEELRKTD